jgi:predicted dehydrogenase
LRKPVHVAVVGTGYGIRTAAKFYAKDPSFKLVAVVGRNTEGARQRLLAADLPPALATTFEILRARQNPGLIHVASPNYAHAAHISGLVDGNWALLLEKPLSIDAEEQRLLADALAARRNPSFINLPLRALREPIRLLRQHPSVGAGFEIDVRLDSPFESRYRNVRTWKTDPMLGGGPFNVLLPHLVDYALYLSRSPGVVTRRLTITLDANAADSTEHLSVSAASGSFGTLRWSTRDRQYSNREANEGLFESLFAPYASSIKPLIEAGAVRHQRFARDVADPRRLVRVYETCRLLIETSVAQTRGPWSWTILPAAVSQRGDPNEHCS